MAQTQSPDPVYLAGNRPAIDDFIDKFDTFLLDCDGVLWSGENVFEGVPETIAMLRAKNKRTVFVTNNSTKSRLQYQQKLQSKGIVCSVHDIFGSAYSSAIYISRILRLPPPHNRVFVIGERGLEDELRAEGLSFVCGTDPSYRRDLITDHDFAAIADGSALDPDVAVVLAGLDFHLNYRKIAHACQHIRRGALFLASNMDATLPRDGSFFPGAGATTAPIAYMVGAQPLALGKPSQAMMDAVEGKFSLDRARTCMVGDRLDTDIRFGIDGRLGGTLAVQTGVHRREDWEAEHAVARPAFYVDKFSDLLGASR